MQKLIQEFTVLFCFNVFFLLCIWPGVNKKPHNLIKGNLDVQNSLYESSVDVGRVETLTIFNLICKLHLRWGLAARENRILCGF